VFVKTLVLFFFFFFSISFLFNRRTYRSALMRERIRLRAVRGVPFGGSINRVREREGGRERQKAIKVRISLLFILLPFFFNLFFFSRLPNHAISCARSRVSCGAHWRNDNANVPTSIFTSVDNCNIIYYLYATLRTPRTS